MHSLASAEPTAAAAVGARPLVALAEVLTGRFGLDLSRCQYGDPDELLASLTGEQEDPAAVQRALTACRMGETMFMRHPEQFSALRGLSATLPSYQQGAPLSIWSAGCSTGEEAYSLASVLDTLSPVGGQVLGTDINAASIGCAGRGQYLLWSLRGLNIEDPELASWLEGAGRQLTVRRSLRERVRFAIHNLVSDPYPAGLDVIFCRNVLLYFDHTAAEAVLQRFAHSLRIGGLLFLGSVDPAPTDSMLWSEEVHAGVRFFRRREPGLSQAPGPTWSVSGRAMALPPAASPQRPAPLPGQPPPHEPQAAVLERARGLAAQRAYRDAIATLEQLCQASALAIEPHVLLAMVAEEGGYPELALTAARRACFLAPESPLTHYLMALNLKAAGDTLQSARHFKLAATQLGALPTDLGAVPFGEGLTARQLRRMIDGHI